MLRLAMLVAASAVGAGAWFALDAFSTRVVLGLGEEVSVTPLAGSCIVVTPSDWVLERNGTAVLRIDTPWGAVWFTQGWEPHRLVASSPGSATVVGLCAVG